MGVSEKWQHFHFGVEYPFNSEKKSQNYNMYFCQFWGEIVEIVYYTLRTVRCKLRILRTKFENSEFISLVFFIRIKSLHLVIMFISHNSYFYYFFTLIVKNKVWTSVANCFSIESS